jgi:hypothetical protein
VIDEISDKLDVPIRCGNVQRCFVAIDGIEASHVLACEVHAPAQHIVA